MIGKVRDSAAIGHDLRLYAYSLLKIANQLDPDGTGVTKELDAHLQEKHGRAKGVKHGKKTLGK